MLDANARAFVASFMADVAAVTGYDANRLWNIAHAKEQLLDALTHDDDAAWARLHRTIARLLDDAADSPCDQGAAASLRSFLRENDDLAGA